MQSTNPYAVLRQGTCIWPNKKTVPMNFLKELRERARVCSNPAYRDLLQEAANMVDNAVNELFEDVTTENMVRLNGAWAYAQAILKQTPDEGTPAPLSGAPEPARLAA